MAHAEMQTKIPALLVQNEKTFLAIAEKNFSEFAYKN
jgi:hypothetical protein